ncbi:Rv3654c family TadE-like protein [Dactylosporangium sp. NPDC050688]|uniref:Rv3654c family TadE-like protein n=1 Tax=Dactylosporangium sp. NPDC050688 TaxID=3157217 RepID=UPI0033F355F5
MTGRDCRAQDRRTRGGDGITDAVVISDRLAAPVVVPDRLATPAVVRDRGSISLLMVVIGFVFVGALVVGIGLSGARVARHRAQNAADAGALAGAVWSVDGPAEACAVAGRLVTANGARLVSCSVDGLEVRVTVEVRLSDAVPAGRASARAGVVSDTSDPPGG